MASQTRYVDHMRLAALTPDSRAVKIISEIAYISGYITILDVKRSSCSDLNLNSETTFFGQKCYNIRHRIETGSINDLAPAFSLNNQACVNQGLKVMGQRRCRSIELIPDLTNVQTVIPARTRSRYTDSLASCPNDARASATNLVLSALFIAPT